jgi:predicted porin
MLGASLTWDGRSGLPAGSHDAAQADDAWGAVVSLNYNRGPWTAGAFAQWSTREGDTARRANDRYRALEAGVSYRLSTRLRLYGAWYGFSFEADGGARGDDRHRGDLVLIGLRATL